MSNTLKRVIAPVAALVAAGAVGGLASVAAWEAIDGESTTTVTATTPVEPVSSTTQAQSSVAGIVERAMPSVVEVKTESAAETFPSPFPNPAPSPRVQGVGSGWVYDDDGHVVTNQHVVGGTDEVTVVFEDGTEVPATVVGADPSTDVAVLKLEEGHEAPVLPLGSTSSLKLGDTVIAIGSPLGLQGTVTAGIVSGLGRDIRAPNEFTIAGAVQTDAALNHGNSGGPLLDSSGRVVGMNAQIASETGANTGIGYAIPVETVKRIADQLIATGKVEHPYLGVVIEDAESGARLVEVRSGSPAAEAGLRQGDVVTEIDGEPVESSDDLRRAVERHKPGDELELAYERDGESATVTVTLGSRPASSA
ncbi:MAG: trypsin-like peptidase domain-containing protein [Thermoleophilia bacterium]|nr:trypsin-like peptidase domain-containing protein [Thermoleophilia bacterium]